MTEQSVFTDADVVVVKKGTQAERKGHTRRGGGTHKQWKQSHQVRHENQHRERHHDREILQTVRADDVLDHVAHREHA